MARLFQANPDAFDCLQQCLKRVNTARSADYRSAHSLDQEAAFPRRSPQPARASNRYSYLLRMSVLLDQNARSDDTTYVKFCIFSEHNRPSLPISQYLQPFFLTML